MIGNVKMNLKETGVDVISWLGIVQVSEHMKITCKRGIKPSNYISHRDRYYPH
jgi:hypothetical protein